MGGHVRFSVRCRDAPDTLVAMWNREPSVIIGAIASAIALLVAFGVHVTDEQAKAVLGAATAMLPLIAAVAIRSQVSPVAKPPSEP